jgi:hypothetical protein
VGEELTIESLGTLRADIAELSATLDAAEESAKSLPHRRTSLLLVTGFLRRLLDLHLDLIDETERQLGSR